MGEQKKLLDRKKKDKRHKKFIQKSAKYGAKKGKKELMEDRSESRGNKYNT